MIHKNLRHHLVLCPFCLPDIQTCVVGTTRYEKGISMTLKLETREKKKSNAVEICWQWVHFS